MKPMRTQEIREAFLSFYARHGHERLESVSLIPVNDPTLLFTSAGMVPFKDVFTGLEKRPYSRATTAQRCLRAGGKHNDLDNVGYTARHHTLFEMLGNFSFGDYFKKEAIRFAWDFSTNVLGLPKDRLYVTIHLSDDEAFKIWTEQEKVPADRIFRFDKDNFWSAGDVGPCGPSSEIFFDRGEKFNTGDPEKDKIGGDGDRFLEFYNIVFMQFERDSTGEMRPLPKPSVDTGMGLERISSILQSVPSNYDIDLFETIFAAIYAASPIDRASLKTDKEKNDYKIATQVIADHLRAVSFMIADGLIPGNDGRSYVLRRILRRAVRYGKTIGFEGPFLYSLVGSLVRQMGEAYPILRERQSVIEKATKSEEEKFFATLERGLSILLNEIKSSVGKKVISGDSAFLLYDSFGFPLDLTQLIAREHGFSVDEKCFDARMESQKTLSRGTKETKSSDLIEVGALLDKAGLATKFLGYEKLSTKARLTALVENGKQIKQILSKSDGAIVDAVFDCSPFYPEGGGQVGDQGEVFRARDSVKQANVTAVMRGPGEISFARLELLPGVELKEGDELELRVPELRRALTAANHSATHLLHWALREILGDHVKQAGSLVNDEMLRFDFTHFQATTPEEITRIENMVNEKILAAAPVGAKVMKKDDAISAGALALFGEKYGEEVRVLKIGDFSTELCGGTHVHNSSEIRLFKIVSEGGVAAGTRRIIALTSQAAFDYLNGKALALEEIRHILKAQSDSAAKEKILKLVAKLELAERAIEEANSKNLANEAKALTLKARELGGIRLLSHHLKGDMAKARALAEHIRQAMPSGVIAIGAEDDGKAILVVQVSKDLVSRVNAGKIIQEIAPLVGGRGGGKPDAAQAGGNNPAGLTEALAAVEALLPRS